MEPNVLQYFMKLRLKFAYSCKWEQKVFCHSHAIWNWKCGQILTQVTYYKSMVSPLTLDALGVTYTFYSRKPCSCNSNDNSETNTYLMNSSSLWESPHCSFISTYKQRYEVVQCFNQSITNGNSKPETHLCFHELLCQILSLCQISLLKIKMEKTLPESLGLQNCSRSK